MQTSFPPDIKIEGLTPGFYVRDADLVPEKYQNVLIAIRDTMTESYFAIGDVANELTVHNALAGLHVTDQRVFDAIGRFCGKSGRTVRYYAETASFFPKDLRKKYSALAFSHFVFAKSMGQDWGAVLDYALGDPSTSVDALKFRFLAVDSSTGERAWSSSETLGNFARPDDDSGLSTPLANIPSPQNNGLPGGGLHNDLARISTLSDSLVWFIDLVSKINMESEHDRMAIMVNCVALRGDIGKVASLLCYNSGAA